MNYLEIARSIPKTPEREDREALLRQALAFLARHYVPGADLHRLDAYEDAVDAAFYDGSMEEFRQAIRDYVRTGEILPVPPLL